MTISINKTPTPITINFGLACTSVITESIAIGVPVLAAGGVADGVPVVGSAVVVVFDVAHDNTDELFDTVTALSLI